jgi:hypothetical protein
VTLKITSFFLLPLEGEDEEKVKSIIRENGQVMVRCLNLIL